MDVSSPIGNLPSDVSVVLSGALDQYQAESLKEQLLNIAGYQFGDDQQVNLDMTAVERIDASCLQILLAFIQSQPVRKPAIRGAIPSVRHSICTAGAEDLFDFSYDHE